MRRKTLAASVISSILIATALLLFKMIHQNDTTAGSDVESSSPKLEENIQSLRTEDRNTGSDRGQLRSALASLASKPAMESDVNSEPPEISYKEPPRVTKEIAELHEKTKDYYFSMAPEILEEMLQEQTVNMDWNKQIEEAAKSAGAVKYLMVIPAQNAEDVLLLVLQIMQVSLFLRKK